MGGGATVRGNTRTLAGPAVDFYAAEESFVESFESGFLNLRFDVVR
jgi:hypothetical protein